jgi:hypothetical protein
MPVMYYSTVVYLKYYIQKNYFSDRHYVWVSEYFNCNSSNPHTPSTLIGTTSNPKDIYLDLKKAYEATDRHSYKINEQIASIKKLAIDYFNTSLITDTERDEIIFMVDKCDFKYWRPVIYLIPKTIDSSRVTLVPMPSRASFGPEYIIKDLNSNEFDLLDI